MTRSLRFGLRRMVPSGALAASVAACSALVAPAVVADEAVEVPAHVAEMEPAPAFARACLVEFDGFSPVVTNCTRECYLEIWDGPILRAVNLCNRPIWVSQEFEGAEGEASRTPCHRIEAGHLAAFPEAGLWRHERRQAVVAIPPGSGYPKHGFTPTCAWRTERIDAPILWLSERRDAADRDGPLGPNALRP